VSAFITRPDRRLLVFSHPESPSAGIQVPAGGIDLGEDPATAAVREAEEETGYAGFTVERFVDRQLISEVRRGRLELHDRCFFHLVPPAGLPDQWRHGEGVGTDGCIPFDFFWIDSHAEPLPLTPDHAEVFRNLRRELWELA
jgi:8-oxo-dGTP pyrophosphatase MutT (NUDIX family)